MRKKCKDCKKDTTKVEFPFESSRCFECRELWYISRRPRINGKTIYDLRKELQLYQRHISNIIGMDRRKYVNIELGVTPTPHDFISKVKSKMKQIKELSKVVIKDKSIQTCSICKKTSEDVKFNKNTRRCISCEKVYHHNWYKENTEKEKKRVTLWMNENPERAKKYREISYHRNRDKILKLGKRWRNKNKEKMAELKSTWRKKNPLKSQEYNNKRRVRGGRSFTSDELEILISLYPFCLKCGTDKQLEVDHIVPLSKGGSNIITNLQMLCKSCNRSKWVDTEDYRPKEFVIELEQQIKELKKESKKNPEQ